MSQTLSQEAWQDLQSLLPARVVKASRGWGSFLTIDFDGAGSTAASIWVYLCVWRLLAGPQEVGSSEALPTAAALIEHLEGRFLEAVKPTEEGLELCFSDGVALSLMENQAAYGVDDLLIAYVGEGRVVSYRSDKGFYREAE